MKIFKKWYLVKILEGIPMHAISSNYFNKVRETNEDRESRLLTQGFEDGYYRCLRDLEVNEKDYPKGKREKQ